MRALVCRKIGPFADSLVVEEVSEPKAEEGEGVLATRERADRIVHGAGMVVFTAWSASVVQDSMQCINPHSLWCTGKKGLSDP